MSISTQTSHKVNINIPYGELQTIIDWCERNCEGEWLYSSDITYSNVNGYVFMFDSGSDITYSNVNGYVFMFDSDRDYVAFLVWKK
jgi:hypothetical protein